MRFTIGQHPVTNKVCYRLCKIEDIENNASAYTASVGESGKVVKTNVRLIVSFGNDKRSIRINPISNTNVTADEFHQHKEHLKSQRLPVPTPRSIKALEVKLFKTISSYVRTDEEVERELRLKRELRPDASVKNIALEIEKARAQIQSSKEALQSAEEELEMLMSRNDDLRMTEDEMMDVTEEDIANYSFDGDAAKPEKVEILKAVLKRKVASAQLSKMQDNLSNLQRVNNVRLAEHSKNKKVVGWDKVNERARGDNKSADYNAVKDKKNATGAESEVSNFFLRLKSTNSRQQQQY